MAQSDINYDEFIPVGKVAKFLSCSVPTIYRWIANGDFPPPRKFGGSSRWSIQDIREFIDSKKVDSKWQHSVSVPAQARKVRKRRLVRNVANGR